MVDRRFNRNHYQARLVEEHFASRLQQVHSAEELAGVWLQTVDESLRPQTSGLWLNPNRIDYNIP
jgi:hypothetical protein